MQVFNLINSRVAGQDQAVTEGLFSNVYFLIIFFGIAIVALPAGIVTAGYMNSLTDKTE